MTDQGMGGHQSARMVSDDWITPPHILEALGEFDLDPCASMTQPWPTAKQAYTVADGGLLLPWTGRIWLNPPYSSEADHWMMRLAQHNDGIALIFARTETDLWFKWVWPVASAILFLKGRVYFHRPDGSRAPHNSGAPSVLIAYGQGNADALALCGLAGKLVKL